MKLTNIALAGVLFGLAGCNGAGGTGAAGGSIPSDGVQIRMGGTKGEKYSTTSTIKMELDTSGSTQPGLPKGPQSMNMEMQVKSELVDVKDGKYSWKDTFSDVKVTGEGMMATGAKAAENQLKGKSYTTVYDQRGKVISTDAGASNPMGMAGGDMNYPDKKLKVGDTWEASTTTNGQTAKVQYKVIGADKVGSVDALVVELKFLEPEMLKKSGPLKIWIDRNNGRTIKMDGVLDIDQGGVKMKMTMKSNPA